jgi:hypothetical protein
MIPHLTDHGYLPAGIYTATVGEIAERFGHQSELRCVEMESLRWLVDLAWRAGALRIIVNGSFVSGVLEPNDVDCVLLTPSGFPVDAAAEKELLEGLPFVTLHLGEQVVFDLFVDFFFASDRQGIAKGMIEVIR